MTHEAYVVVHVHDLFEYLALDCARSEEGTDRHNSASFFFIIYSLLFFSR